METSCSRSLPDGRTSVEPQEHRPAASADSHSAPHSVHRMFQGRIVNSSAIGPADCSSISACQAHCIDSRSMARKGPAQTRTVRNAAPIGTWRRANSRIAGAIDISCMAALQVSHGIRHALKQSGQRPAHPR